MIQRWPPVSHVPVIFHIAVAATLIRDTLLNELLRAHSPSLSSSKGVRVFALRDAKVASHKNRVRSVVVSGQPLLQFRRKVAIFAGHHRIRSSTAARSKGRNSLRHPGASYSRAAAHACRKANRCSWAHASTRMCSITPPVCNRKVSASVRGMRRDAKPERSHPS
jgi:hypothetical protein